MFLEKNFKLRRKNYKTFQEFLLAVKYYLRRYKNNPEVEITVNRNDFSIEFIAINPDLYFY